MADKYIPKKAVSGKVLLRNWWNSVVESNFSAIFKAFSEHVAGTADKHSAEHIDYDENTDLKTKIDRKADKASVDEALEQKADKTSVDAALEQKADKTSVDEALERIKYYGSADVVPSDASYFTVNETGETITGLTDYFRELGVKDVVIPYKIDGITITGIGTYIFGDFGLEKIRLPNSITDIGKEAFAQCSVLKTVNIPNGVTSIEEASFVSCSALTSINIPDSVTTIGACAFIECGLSSIEIPESVTTIEERAFELCSSMSSIIIPRNVKSIGKDAFSGCTNLTIYCEQGSYAETYAKENNISVVYTDINESDWNAKADKTIVDEINVASEQNSEALSVLKQRSIPHAKVSGYPISVTDHLDAEQVIDYKVYGNSVQDGTPSTENPSEIKSVGDLVTDEASEYYGKYDIPINMRGKNIFSGLTKGLGISSANGSEVTNKDYAVSGYIPVNFNVNTNYLISGLPTTISTLIAAYNINKEFLGRTTGFRSANRLISSDVFTLGTPQATGDVVYLRVMCYANNPAVETVDDIDGCKIQLEIGDTATEYEPYNSGETKHIYLDEPLRKVGDYADYIDYRNQKVIRQVELLDSTGTKTIDESIGVLDTPVEESITIPELTTLISSVANVSTFTTIQPSNMEVTYYQDINKKIAELQAAITALGGI